MNQPTGPHRLRELLARPGITASLGAHDVFTALLIEQMGFETVFVGGFGASASALGLPDLGLLTVSEMAQVVRRMTARLSIPLVADGDTGHGDLHNVQRTVELFEQAGAAAIILEDQVTPKRCGHFADKQIIPAEEMVLKIKAAVRAKSDPELVIIARTDARQMRGPEEAIERANRYGQAGADVLFIEAPQSVAELEAIPHRVDYPLLVNVLTGGVTPILALAELEQLGYKLAVYPVESLMICAQALRRLGQALQTTGRVDHLSPEMVSFTEVKQILGVAEFLSLREGL